MTLSISHIADRAAAAAGISPEKATQVIGTLFDRIIKYYMKGDHVHIDGFGVFRLGIPSLPSNQRYQFYPAEELINAINAPRPDSDPDSDLDLENTFSQLDHNIHMLKSAPGILPVHPIRREDEELIERWAATRRGLIPEAVNVSLIYRSEEMPPGKVWAEDTVKGARNQLRTFARRVQVPLRDVGLREGDLFSDESVRSEIVSYAKDYEARSKPRLEHYLKLLSPEEQRKKGPLIWRTRTWVNFIDAGTEFYNWLERQGLRPRGSNPFRGIRRLPPLDLMRGRTVIVERWYVKIMHHPGLKPKQQAILHLLCCGLRCHEVATARIERLALGKGMIEVVGKGGKIRKVFLFKATVKALDAYLVTRSHLVNPWLFPSTRQTKFGHMSTRSIEKMVERVVRIVFPRDTDAPIRARISPHKFRHYYVSNSLRLGMDAEVLMSQVGHGGRSIIERYKNFDPVWIEREVRRIDRKGETP